MSDPDNNDERPPRDEEIYESQGSDQFGDLDEAHLFGGNLDDAVINDFEEAANVDDAQRSPSSDSARLSIDNEEVTTPAVQESADLQEQDLPMGSSTPDFGNRPLETSTSNGNILEHAQHGIKELVRSYHTYKGLMVPESAARASSRGTNIHSRDQSVGSDYSRDQSVRSVYSFNSYGSVESATEELSGAQKEFHIIFLKIQRTVSDFRYSRDDYKHVIVPKHEPDREEARAKKEKLAGKVFEETAKALQGLEAAGEAICDKLREVSLGRHKRRKARRWARMQDGPYYTENVASSSAKGASPVGSRASSMSNGSVKSADPAQSDSPGVPEDNKEIVRPKSWRWSDFYHGEEQLVPPELIGTPCLRLLKAHPDFGLYLRDSPEQQSLELRIDALLLETQMRFSQKDWKRSVDAAEVALTLADLEYRNYQPVVARCKYWQAISYYQLGGERNFEFAKILLEEAEGCIGSYREGELIPRWRKNMYDNPPPEQSDDTQDLKARIIGLIERGKAQDTQVEMDMAVRAKKNVPRAKKQKSKAAGVAAGSKKPQIKVGQATPPRKPKPALSVNTHSTKHESVKPTPAQIEANSKDLKVSTLDLNKPETSRGLSFREPSRSRSGSSIYLSRSTGRASPLYRSGSPPQYGRPLILPSPPGPRPSLDAEPQEPPPSARSLHHSFTPSGAIFGANALTDIPRRQSAFSQTSRKHRNSLALKRPVENLVIPEGGEKEHGEESSLLIKRGRAPTRRESSWLAQDPSVASQPKSSNIEEEDVVDEGIDNAAMQKWARRTSEVVVHDETTEKTTGAGQLKFHDAGDVETPSVKAYEAAQRGAITTGRRERRLMRRVSHGFSKHRAANVEADDGEVDGEFYGEENQDNDRVADGEADGDEGQVWQRRRW